MRVSNSINECEAKTVTIGISAFYPALEKVRRYLRVEARTIIFED
jgi:hypothetical protein